ncbi:MAG: hypothetical protein KF746_17545 [Chitinophagaceae bacterium]|nr:hypothetical protein [Chitinophagaceae bacterium]
MMTMIRIAGCCLVVLFHLTGCNGNRQDNVNGQPKTEKKPNGRNDAWGYAGYGGGGAMFYPTVSPFDPGHAFVACDMTGSFVTYDGGESWRMFNLRGPVHFFTFDPSDPNTVYANSIALFKSTDKGNTWNVVYPSASDITAVISKGDHANEVLVTRDSTIRRVQAFAVDPADSKKLYAVISIDQKNGFYTSADGGSNWIKETDMTVTAGNIFIAPSSPKNKRTVYIATGDGILTNENGSWEMNALPAGVKKITTCTGGYDSAQQRFIIYAIAGRSYFNPDDDESGIYFTNDGGKTWQNRQEGIISQQSAGAGIPEWRTIATSALHPATVYVSYNNFILGDTTCIGVAKSDNYGKTWTLVWKDRLAKGGSVVSENFTGGWLNERFGPTWGENPFSIGVSPVNPDVCYATDFGRTVKSDDGGTTWKQVYTRKEGPGWVSRGLEVTTSYDVVTDPFDSNHVFICNTDIGLMESTDGGHSWKSATQNNGVPRQWVNSAYWLTFDPDIKGKAWAVMSANHDLPRPKMWRRAGVANYKGGILVTGDAGKTWTPVSSSIGEAAFTHILADPSSNEDARTLYACAFGKGVYKSVDGGKTWQQKNKGLEGKEPFAWRIMRRETDGVLFLMVSRRSEKGEIGTPDDGALYRSTDGAETWTKMTLPEGTNAPTSIIADAQSPQRLILSAWGKVSGGKFSTDTGGGIFVSGDDGNTWKQVMQKDQHIHDITFDDRNKTYYACGFNSSAYRSTDKGETWERIKGYNFKWGKRVVPDPVHPGKVYIVTFGGGIWYGPENGDAGAEEDIVTPVLSYK